MKFSLPLEVKAADLAPTGEFTGYAAVFGNVDLGGDMIVPGAFEKSIAEHRQRGSFPALLWSHDASVVLGTLKELREDSKGLFTSAKLTLETKAAAEAYALLRDGAVGGMSIGYSIADRGAEISGNTRLLKQVELHEVSLVAMPMNREARVTAVKAFADMTHPRELEQELRAHFHLSNRLAKKWVSKVWSEDEDGDAPLERELDRILKIASQLKGI